MRPGSRLRSLARRVCSQSTMDRLIDPVIADLQCEHAQAIRDDRRWRRRWILLTGYAAFWKAVACHVPIWTRRIVHGCGASESGTVAGALGAAAVTMIVLTLLLIAVPWLRMPGATPGRMAWLFVMLLPQSIPLSLPFVLLVGVLWGLRNRTVTAPIRRAILVIGLAGSLVSFGSIAWLIPAANQAFRVTIAGHQLDRGPAEMPPASLRERALAMQSQGRPLEAGRLFLDYHLRGALAGAVLVFALFGLGVTALRLGRVANVGIAIIACVLYINYIDGLSQVNRSAFSDERVALSVAWLPNVSLMLTALAFLSARRETRFSRDMPPS